MRIFRGRHFRVSRGSPRMFRQLFRCSPVLLFGGSIVGVVSIAQADGDVDIPAGNLVCCEFFVPRTVTGHDLEDPQYERLLGGVALGHVVARGSLVPIRSGAPVFVRLGAMHPGMIQGVCPFHVPRDYYVPASTPRVSLRHFSVRDSLFRHSPIGSGRPGMLLQVTLSEGPSANELSVVMRVDGPGGGPPLELERLFDTESARPVHYLTVSPFSGDFAPMTRVVFFRWESLR